MEALQGDVDYSLETSMLSITLLSHLYGGSPEVTAEMHARFPDSVNLMATTILKPFIDGLSSSGSGRDGTSI